VAFVAASAIITRSAVSGATSASGFRFAPGTAAPLLLISLVWALYNGGCLILSSFVPAFFVAHGMSLALADGLPYPGEAAWYVVSAGSMSRHMKPRGAAGAALPRKNEQLCGGRRPERVEQFIHPAHRHRASRRHFIVPSRHQMNMEEVRPPFIDPHQLANPCRGPLSLPTALSSAMARIQVSGSASLSR
jgi:hypothetical protein